MSDSATSRVLALSGSLISPLRWLIGLTALPALGALIAAIAGINAGRDPSSPAWMLPAIALLVPVIVALMLTWLVRSMRRAGVHVDAGELVVNTGLGSKRVALARLRAAGLRVVDLDERTELKPWLRLWGTALPGFRAGWVRLRNGEKAVCLLLDRRRVSYLRSDDGMSLLLSLAHPEELRALLERRGG